MYYPCLPFTTLRAIKGRTTQESMSNYSRGYYVQLHCLLEIKMKALPPCGMLCAAQNNTKRNNLRCSFFPRRMMQDKTFPGWCCDIGQIDRFFIIELFPLSSLSSDNTNCKNDIPFFHQLFDELSVYRDYH